MEIRSLCDRVLIVRIEGQEKAKIGIIVPDKTKGKKQEGKIVAIGPGNWVENGTRISLEVQKCDHMLFGEYAGNEIKIDVVEYLIRREDDIIDIIDK